MSALSQGEDAVGTDITDLPSLLQFGLISQLWKASGFLRALGKRMALGLCPLRQRMDVTCSRSSGVS